MSEPRDPTRLWPASPYDLADATRCPGCFSPITRSVCEACGFAFSDERAPAVLSLGNRILSLEIERQQLMETIRGSARAAALAEAAAMRRADAASRVTEPTAAIAGPSPADLAALDPGAPVAASIPVPGQVPAAAPVSGPVPAAAPVPGPVPAAPVPGHAPVPSAPVVARAPRRRLTVPVLLLIVGVSLVGVAAVFFLLVAWFVADIAVRAMIIGGVTLATILAASWLRHRSLTATAEGIAVLGVILLALDAWALRANDLFGTGATDAALYAGAAGLVVGGICRVWAFFSRLRGPDLAASLALPAGIGLLIGGALALEPGEALVAGLLGASAGGLLHALPAPWSAARGDSESVPERLVLAIVGVAALVAAPVAAAIGTGDDVAVILWSSALVLVLGVAHAWLLRPREGRETLPAAGVLAGVASSVAVATAGLAGWQLSFRTDLEVYPLLVAPVLGVTVGVAADLLHARRGGIPAAAITGRIIAGLSLAISLIFWAAQGVFAAASAWSAWLTDPFVIPSSAPVAPYLAIPAAVVLSALLLVAPSASRPVLRELRPVVIALLVLAASLRPAVPALEVGAAILVLAVSLVALRLSRSGDPHRPLAGGAGSAGQLTDPGAGGRGGWVAAGVLAAVVAYAASTTSPWLWTAGIVVALAAPIAQRLILRPTGTSAVVLAVAPVAVAALSTVFAPAALGYATDVDGNPIPVTLALMSWVALAALASAAWVPLDADSRTALTWAGYALVGLAILVGALQSVAIGASSDGALRSVIGEPLAGVVRGILLGLVLTLVALRRTRVDGPVTLGAAGLLAPVLAATAFAALDVAGAAAEGWSTLVPLATAVAVVGASAWLGFRAASGSGMPHARVAAEAGAAVTAGALLLAPQQSETLGVGGGLNALGLAVWPVRPDLVWVMWILVAVGFAAASITRGWTAPASASPEDDVFATRSPGVALHHARRRLFVWPAAAAGILAWWAILDGAWRGGAPTVEAYAVPAGVALTALAVALVRLRRRGEAAIALGGGLALGLWWPAVVGWSGAGLRGILVALASVLAVAALSAPPLRRVRPPALVGSTVALAGLSLVVVERAITGAPRDVAWLLVLVAVGYASAVGALTTRPERSSSTVYGQVVPATTVAVATIAVLAWRDDAAVMLSALGALVALHVAAAAVDRLPLGAATRWTAMAGATLVAGMAIVGGAIDELEAVTLPLALAWLAGAAATAVRAWRAGAPELWGERWFWIIGLGFATVPSLFMPADTLRTWGVIAASLAAGAAIGLLEVLDTWRVRTLSVVTLGGAALAMGVRVLADPTAQWSAAAAIIAGIGALALAVILVAATSSDIPSPACTWLAALGVALVGATLVVESDGELLTTAVTVIPAAVAGVGGAWLLGLRTWRGIGAVLALGGLAVAIIGCGIRFWVVAFRPGLEADFWAVVAGVITVAVAVSAMRAAQIREVDLTAGGAIAVAVALFATAEITLLSSTDDLEGWRTVVSMTVLSAAAALGFAWRGRLGLALAIAGAVSAIALGVVALVLQGVRPVELVTVPPALAGLGYGARTLRRDAKTRTWPALGPWILLLTLPPLLYDFGESTLWRVVGLGIVALALVVLGAVFRLQAPLVLGSAILLIHGVAQLWPWISTTYTVVPWWLWLGIGGALLIFIAATYERRKRQLKTAFVAVTALR